LANFEVQVRGGDVPARAGAGDDRAAQNLHPFAYQERGVVRVDGGEVAMLKDDEVAVAAQLGARVGDHAVAGGVHRRPRRHRQVDAEVRTPVAHPEGRRERRIDRPAERAAPTDGVHANLRTYVSFWRRLRAPGRHCDGEDECDPHARAGPSPPHP
jgi:hypothetical protein